MANETTAAQIAPSAEPDAASLRSRLRTGSGDRHARLDARFEGMHSADDPSLYHRFIAVNEACHAAIEPCLDRTALVEFLPDWPSRNRAALLRRDLDEMGVAPLPRVIFRDEVPELSEAVGIAYVLEGSRVGARYLHRLMRARAGEPRWSGLSLHYLASAEEQDFLRPFLVRAADLIHDETSRDRAVAGANATFDFFLETERFASSGNPSPAIGRVRAQQTDSSAHLSAHPSAHPSDC